MSRTADKKSPPNAKCDDFKHDTNPVATESDFIALPIDAKYDRLNRLVHQSKVYSEIIAKNMTENSKRYQKSAKYHHNMTQRSEFFGIEEPEKVQKETCAGIDYQDICASTKRRKSSRLSKRKYDSDSMSQKGSSHAFGETRTQNMTMVDNRHTNPNEAPRNFSHVKQPAIISGCIMKDYQLEGLEWLVSLYENGLNGILADEMGLGKTLQCIALYGYLIEHGVRGPFLVITPLSTIKNWQHEFERFAPSIHILIYVGSKPERASLNFLSSKATVFITSYEIIMKDHLKFAKVSWEYLTVDEGHRLKNFQSILVKYLKRLRVGNRLLLTGTPLQNNLSELWSLLNFILPDIFHDLKIFESWFNFDELICMRNDLAEDADKEMGNDTIQSTFVAQLHSILQPFLLRRLKSEVIKNLPPKKEYIVLSNLSPLQRLLYSSVKNATLKSTITCLFLKEYLLELAPKVFRSEEGLTFIDKILTSTYSQNEGSLFLPSNTFHTDESSFKGGKQEDVIRVSLATAESVQENWGFQKLSFNGKRNTLPSVGSESFPRLYKKRRVPDAIKSSKSSVHLTQKASFSTNILATTKMESEPHEEVFGKSCSRMVMEAFQLIEKHMKSSQLQNGIMQLRKICASHYTFYDPLSSVIENHQGIDSRLAELMWNHSGKIQILEELTSPLLAEDHKILIFSQFTKVLDLLALYFQNKGVNCSRLDGRVNQDRRTEEIEYFSRRGKDSASVFLLSTRAGGLGLNLVQADTVVLFDSDWNPQMDLQAIDRVHRIGQEKPIKIFRLVVRDTIEELLLLKSFGKRALEKMVIEQGHFQLGKVAEKLIKENTDFSVFNTLDSIFNLEQRMHSHWGGLHDFDSSTVNKELLKHCTGRSSILSTKEIEELMDRTPECYQRPSGNFESVTHFETANNMDT